MSPGLWETAALLRTAEFTDLSHHFAPDQPRFPGDPDATLTRLSDAASDGFTIDQHCFVGPWGTHVDAPAHVDPAGRTLSEISPRDSILPLVVLDLSAEAAANPDVELSPTHLHSWEAIHGQIPAGSFVALRTDWSLRWDSGQMYDTDSQGHRHSPGWSVAALQLLHQRQVIAIGHETLDADPGASVELAQFPAQRWWLEHDHWQIEALTNLAALPATGALIIATWPVPRDGVAFPARACALVLP
ncbi:cyclase family protein [Corynebacterium alimapuense]|uniref:Cyclase n=1 Tax=Corynebacterium alimapuense TaxID=1576874 RepID=A0A3M8K5T0_9CORY|nr:cyclase family protein [Corynebacterium alimapuense]RNE48583.1 cyclase [Corynebacterium alimapuense]